MDDFQSLDNLNYSSIGQILNTTQRLEFTTAEVQGAVSFIKQNISKGLGTGLHPFMRDDFAEVIADGFFGIELEEAQTTVLFVKSPWWDGKEKGMSNDKHSTTNRAQ